LWLPQEDTSVVVLAPAPTILAANTEGHPLRASDTIQVDDDGAHALYDLGNSQSLQLVSLDMPATDAALAAIVPLDITGFDRLEGVARLLSALHGRAIPPDAGHYVSEDGGPRLMRSVIYARNAHGRAIHPTEKPAPLLEILIRTSCPEGGLVADWFAGSGAAGEACRLTSRRYLGCEIDAAMAEKARARIGAVLPFDGRAAL
jgi:hypothetical protein